MGHCLTCPLVREVLCGYVLRHGSIFHEELLMKTNSKLPSREPQAPDDEALMFPKDAAKFLNRPENWLAKRRVTGDGPPYVKLGIKSSTDAPTSRLGSTSTSSPVHRKRSKRPTRPPHSQQKKNAPPLICGRALMLSVLHCVLLA